jgi:filamentous hemagglutinin
LSVSNFILNQETGNMLAGKNLVLKDLNSMTNQGTLMGVNSVTVDAYVALSNQKAGKILSAGHGLLAVKVINNEGEIKSGANIELRHDNQDVVSHILEAALSTQKQMRNTDNHLELLGQTLENSGQIVSQGNTTVVVSKNITNHPEGTLLASQDLKLKSLKEITNTGVFAGRENIAIDSSQFVNEKAGQIYASGKIDVSRVQNFVNKGIVANQSIRPMMGSMQQIATTPINIISEAIDNTGILASTEGITLTATQGVLNNTGTISSEKDIHLSSQSEINNSGQVNAIGSTSVNFTGQGKPNDNSEHG